MPTHPVVLDYSEAYAQLDGKNILIPTIGAAAYILVTQGADQIYIPMHGQIKESAADTISKLPYSLRRMVKLVDTTGSISRRTENYFEPIEEVISGESA